MHRKYTTCLNDVSSDLAALSRVPVLVVSAGIKSILDIPNTLEHLEALEVPVAAWKTDAFPAFFSPDSGVTTPHRVDTADDVAKAWRENRRLGMPQGMLVAVPNHDPAGETVENAIQQALVEASENEILGNKVTPFVLTRVAELTGNDSVRSNVQLVQKNASVGAEIAVAIAATMESCSTNWNAVDSQQLPSSSSTVEPPRVVVFGGVVVDFVAKASGELILDTSNPAKCYETDGGVARNIAEVLGRLGSNPSLHSAVGDDARGEAVVRRLEEDCGVGNASNTVQKVQGATTPTYLAVLNRNGDLHVACADTKVLTKAVPPESKLLMNAEFLVLDANPPVGSLLRCAKEASQFGTKVFLEPTCVAKAIKISSSSELLSSLTFASPNREELVAMATGKAASPGDESNIDILEQHARLLLPKMNAEEAHLIVTLGEHGVLLASKLDGTIFTRHFPAVERAQVENATGAGDTLSGAFIHSLLMGSSIEESVSFGMEAASLTLDCSSKTISPEISKLSPVIEPQ